MGFEDLLEVKVNVMLVFFVGLVLTSLGNGHYPDHTITEPRDDRLALGINLY